MAKIQNPQDQNGINLVNQETFSGEISRIDGVTTALDTAIKAETQRATGAENGINTKIADLEDKILNKELLTWDVETSFSDGATNVFKFECDSPISGIITNVRIYCSTRTGAGGASYLEIRQNNKILGRSINSQTHTSGALLDFNFNGILLNLGERYSFHIVNSNGTKPSESCLALNLKTNVSEVSNLNVQVEGYPNHTPRFGFTYYKKSNINLIDYTLNQTVKHSSDNSIHINDTERSNWNITNFDHTYDGALTTNTDIVLKPEKANNITSVENGVFNFSDGTSEIVNLNRVLTGRYALRTGSRATRILTDFNTREEWVSLESDENGNYLIKDSAPNTNSNPPSATGGGIINQAYHEMDAIYHKEFKDDETVRSLMSLTNGDSMFIRSNITTFNDDLSCLLNGSKMFASCAKLKNFKSALPSLTNGYKMFVDGEAMEIFKTKLPSLVIGVNMFSAKSGNSKLKAIYTCLPNLTIGRQMFWNCQNLTTVDVTRSSFQNLYLADEMFDNCLVLTSVNGTFESLETGINMFRGTKLNYNSLLNFADTIKDWSLDTNIAHSLGTIGYGDEVTVSELDEIAKKLKRKGWSFTLSGKAGNISSDTVVID